MDKIEITLTRVEFNLVLAGLLELPAKESMDLILRLDGEAKAQITKAEELKVRSMSKTK